MTVDTIIRNGKVVTPEGIVEGDVAISGEHIASIGTKITGATREIDASGCWVMPGGVDPHAHIEQMSGMGVMNADTFETATTSAAMGGTTSVISFAAQAKGQTLADTVADYAARAQRGAMIDHAFHMTVTDTAVPGFAEDLGQLIHAGHRSIKVFTTYNIQLSDQEILQTMALARAHGALVCVHAENDAIIAHAKDDLIAKGHLRPSDHALSHPPMAEIESVARMCRFAEYLDQPVMLFHISTAQAAALVQDARARGGACLGRDLPALPLYDR